MGKSAERFDEHNLSSMKDEAINRRNEIAQLSFGELFKLRDSVGLIHAIIGLQHDYTLSQLAYTVQEALNEREAKKKKS